mmetsp:Transcript_91/g.139  ORF Transcript_91/g.139 Transcript_91/m.139 type:complete len:80 (-) Transcript_91:78-317(-)
MRHLLVCARAMKPGARLYIFVWAGSYPVRGTGKQEVNAEQGWCQNNKWAAGYMDEVTAVFGEGSVFVDANANYICVVKR